MVFYVQTYERFYFLGTAYDTTGIRPFFTAFEFYTTGRRRLFGDELRGVTWTL